MKLSKTFVSLIGFSCLLIQVSAQNWQPLGTGVNGGFNSVRVLFADTIDNKVYVGGGYEFAGGLKVNGIAQWDGVQYDSLGSGGDGGNILAITRYNNDIWIGGGFNYVGGILVNDIAKWDGTQWDSLGPGTNGSVWGFLVYNGELYVTGTFSSIGGISASKIAKWNGTTWTSFPVLDNVGGGFGIASAAFYKGELYVGGNFNGGTGLRDIAKFDGTNWQTVGGGFSGANTWVNNLYVWHDTLFVAGYFQKTGGDSGNNIVAWDGNSWSDVGGGAMPSNVHDLVDFQESLYVCGQINEAGGIPVNRMARWDGEQWCNVPADIKINDTQAGTPMTLSVFNDELYVGGGFLTIDGDTMNNIAKWTGGNFSDTCGVLIGVNDQTPVSTEISIYPNPTTGRITVTGLSEEPAKITVYNVLGELMYNRSFIDESIDLSYLPVGVYMLDIVQRKSIFRKKFIKVF